jgi:hypothetical protein
MCNFIHHWNSLKAQQGQGPMLWFWKYFRKNSAFKLPYLFQNTSAFWKNWIITLVFTKNANIFTENGQKSQIVVIIILASVCQTLIASLRTRDFSYLLWKYCIFYHVYISFHCTTVPKFPPFLLFSPNVFDNPRFHSDRLGSAFLGISALLCSINVCCSVILS